LGKGCEKEVKEMAEKLKCPYCEAEFKNSRALGSHVRYKHPRELGLATPPQEEPEEKEVPDAARDFELLLNDYGVTKAPIIVKNIAATGSSDVFDDPKQLAKKLAKWPRDMAPMYRASILEHWLNSRGIILPEELLEELGNYLKLVRYFHSSVPEPHLAKLRVCSPSNWVEPSSFLRYSLGSQPIELSPLKEAVYGRLRPIDRLD